MNSLSCPLGRRIFRNWAWFVSLRPQLTVGNCPPSSVWSLMILCLCSLLASECNKLSKTPLCAFCGSDTFACGSNMLMALSDPMGNQSSSGPNLNPNFTSSLPSHSLNAKVQQVLLKLNRHLQVFNSSNCTCVPLSWRCDGEPDCPDSSDEIGCDKSTCSTAHEFSCATNLKCISKTLFCDGNDDCGDNSDEIDCTPRECDIELETRCDNGRCIPSEWLCDLFDDCGDLSDERCINACSSAEFQCHSGACIALPLYCNNETDCVDMSDELDCESKSMPTVMSSHISCPASHFMCHNGLCISELYQCDGDNDCGDLSDEKGCDGRIKCRVSEFLCTNGQCINQDWRCDGDFDCDDMSDELNCPSQICSKEQFRCRSGRCIRVSWRCDGDKDCEDNSDEEGCTHRNECTSGNFRCRDGTCVSLSNVCNGAPNCPDGSDEDTNSTCVPGVVPCRENGFPCQHLCVATTSGHFCACKEGYRKGSDGRSCIDIDECQIGNLKSELDIHYWSSEATSKEQSVPNVQVCSQLCANSVPGFQCSCANGYRLRTDKRRCKAVQGPEAVLITAQGEHFSFSLLDFFSTIHSEVKQDEMFNLTSLKPMISMDFLFSHKQIFWSNPKTQQIFSALVELNQKSLIFANNRQLSSSSTLRLHQVRAIIESGLVMPTGLAVDWINNRLFFTDTGTSRIEFCNLDGSLRKVLFHQFVHKPHSIVTHPEQSKIYWSDWGEPARIESAFMDGSARQVIVSSLLNMPTGLVIDYPASKIYWADIKGNMIECSNLDGSSRFIIVHDQVYRPVSLAIFEDNLYWGSANLDQIQTVNKLTGNNVTTVAVSAFARPEFDVSIKVFHPLRQPEVNVYPCQSHSCSHLCLPNNSSYRCSCPFGYSFENDNVHKCQVNSNSLLLFTHRNDIRAVTVSKNRFIPESDVHYNDLNLAHVLPIAHISFVVSFDFDMSSSTIFWSDLVNKSIGRAKWTERQQENIITSSLEAPSGIAFDWATSNLYWTDTGRNVIEVAKTNGAFRSLVVWRSLDQPRDIVLDPVNAIMFWTQWSNNTANIERAGMDGSFRIILHSLNLTRPHGLALDHLYKRLYWTDSGRSLIECSFYDGTDRRTVISKNVHHPFALAIAGDFIYWSDLQQRNVQQAHKITGEMQSILFEDTDSLMDIAVLQHNRSIVRHEFAFTNACKQAKCSHLCLLSPLQPGFKCFCPTGIRLLTDELTCADDMTKYLIFTTRKAIRRISLESDHHYDVSIAIEHQMDNAFVVDVNPRNQTVFWSDTNKNVIFRANIRTGKVEPVVRFGLLGSNGLAVDRVGQKLYWTDAGRKRIEVANLDGSYRKVLISRDLDSPRAIAVNHKSGHMVWTDWGSQVRIERSNMDGGERAILVNSHLGWPNGITITRVGRIIWADSKTHSIEMIDLNGANRRTLAEDLPSPYGVAVMDDYLYWTDWHSKTINRMYLPSESDLANIAQSVTFKMEIFAKSLSNLVDIRAIDQEEEEQAFSLQHNMCQVNNGGCSHLCLRNSAPGYSCLCPTGMTMRTDGKTCKSDISTQLLLACKKSLRRISLESQELNDVYLPVNDLVDVVSIDFHFSRGQIYYIDAALNEIRLLTLENHNLSYLGPVESFSVQSVVSTDMSQPSSLAVDWIADNLYWSDQERHLIEVARLDGSSRKVLIDLDLDRPKCLHVLPDLGLLFWINVGQIQRIERAFLDGSGRYILVNTDIGQLNGLTVDLDQDREMARLYWTDGALSRIESIQIDGKDRQTVLSKGITLPFSVAVLDDFIYWTDSYNKVIERANRWTTEDFQLIADNLDSLQEIKIISHLKQSKPIMPQANTSNANPCASDNGACSHLCLFRPHGYICACPSYPEPRPCSTVPGEITTSQLAVTSSIDIKNIDHEKGLFNQSFLSTEAVPNWNNVKLSDPDDNGNLQENGNESLRLKDLKEMCQDHNLTRCDSSRFSFDDHIIQVTYVLALIFLSLAVIICSILTFFCKRKLMEEEAKLSKFPNNGFNQQVPNLGLNNNSIVTVAVSKGFNQKPLICHSQADEAYAQLEGHCMSDNLPPPPPPPRRLANCNLDYELLHSLDLRFPTLSPDQLNRTQLFNTNFAHPIESQFGSRWTQTLPPPRRPAVGTHSHSAFNSPYLGNKSIANRRHAEMTYLCLESNKLETDI